MLGLRSRSQRARPLDPWELFAPRMQAASETIEPIESAFCAHQRHRGARNGGGGSSIITTL